MVILDKMSMTQLYAAYKKHASILNLFASLKYESIYTPL